MINKYHAYNVLVVGNTQHNVEQLMQELRRDYTVFHVHNREEAAKTLSYDIEVVIAEQRVFGQSAQDFFNTVAISPEAIWILLGDQTEPKAFINKALHEGILYHYIIPPWQPEEICNLVKRALEHKEALRELHCLKTQSLSSQAEPAPVSLTSRVATDEQQPGISPSVSNLEPQPNELWQILKKVVQTEKMAALGQMIAEVAHEINTPSGAINAAVVNINHYLRLLLESYWEFDKLVIKQEHLRQIMRIVDKMLTVLDEKPRRTPGEVRNEQKNIIEKLRQHNIKNSRKVAKDIARMGLTGSLDELLSLTAVYDIDSILSFFNNCSRIINSARDIQISIDFLTQYALALKSYSSQSQKIPEPADIHESIDTALIILNNKLKHRIQVDFRQGDVPDILGYSGELSHVWLNIIDNAIQAIEGEGQITIETFATDQYVGVKLTDTGTGIPEDTQSRIFDLNFTTKPHGKGTGLGLYITHQIIKKHGGTISVNSIPGQTTFEVHLPLSPPSDIPTHAES